MNAYRREQTITLTLNERGKYEEVDVANPVDPRNARERLSAALETLVGAGPIADLTTDGNVDARIDAMSVEQAEDLTGRIVQLFRVVAFPEDGATRSGGAGG